MTLCFASSFVPLVRPVASRHACVAIAPVVVSTPMMSMRGSGRSPRRFDKSFGGGNGGPGGAGGDGNLGGVGGSQGNGGGGGGGSSSSGDSQKPTNPFASVWASYNASLETHPIFTKAMTSFIGFFLGDLLAQKFLGEKDAALDGWRLLRMAAFGFMVHGPTGHYFYNALDRLLVGKTPLIVGSKVFIDQVCWAPVFTVLFFSFLGIAERKSMEEIGQKVQGDLWAGITASWKFWPLAHVINFSFVPTSQRLLYINTLQVAYNMILSVLGNREVPAPVAES